MDKKRNLIDYLYQLNWEDNRNIECYDPFTGEVSNFNQAKSSITYSKEELDYFINDYNPFDYDLEDLLAKEEQLEKLKITANISTSYNRLDTLLLTLKSIKGQFDEIRIYLNDFDYLPDELKEYKVFSGQEPLFDKGKFIWSEREGEFYFTLNDNIIYPPDYVEKTLPLIQDRIVCYSGKKINTSNLDEYYENHLDIESYDSLDHELPVDIVDTSTMAFNTNIFYSNLWKSPALEVTDLLVSLEATIHEIPIVCLPHKSGWIKTIYRRGPKETYDKYEDSNRHLEILKMISIYKKLPDNKLSVDKIFDTFTSDSLENLQNKIKDIIPKDYKTFYHVGSGISTNILHLSLISEYENYISVETEEFRTRFAKKTYHGKARDFTGNFNFVISDLERFKFDEKSIILINHYIAKSDLEKIWNNVPSGSYILVSNNSVLSESILTINCETVSGEIRKVHLVKKKEESEKYEFKNIPLKFSQVKDKIKLGIPKIVHHIAHSDSNKWFPNWNQCYQTWIKHFPDFEHKIWDDDDIIKLIDEEFPWYKDIYLSYDRSIKRYDVARPLILYKFGGIYADMDYIAFENFYDLMPQDKISTPVSPYRFQEYIQNALFISPQNHPFWLMFVDFTIDRLHIKEVLKSTGPIAISDCFYANYSICKKWLNILPDKIYNPNPDTPDIASPDIKTRHLCTNTWTSKVRPGLLLEK